MKRIRTLLALIVGVFVLTACSGGAGGSSAPVFSYGGTWKGTTLDTLAGEGQLTASLTQSGNDLGGTWSVNYPGLGITSGQVLGIINENEVILEMLPSNPDDCPLLAVTTRSGSTLKGTYSSYNCSTSLSGEITATKQ